MTSDLDQKGKVLSRISVAARAALTEAPSVDIGYLFGGGLSVRARSRLALLAAFCVVLPTLFFSVIRIEKVQKHASLLISYEEYLQDLLKTKLLVRELELSLWTFISEKEHENAQAALIASGKLKRRVISLVAKRPALVDLGPAGFLEGLVGRLDGHIKRSVSNEASMAAARLGTYTLMRELEFVEEHVDGYANLERQQVLGALSTVGRDQLVLCLILLIAVPVFLLIVPWWTVAPLRRLRRVAHKVELGKLRDIAINGQDEVASLARSLKSFLLKKEDLDQKKSSKIFEMRNIFRALLIRVDEPVFIVDNAIRINYTNEAASSLIGLPAHQMEGKGIGDCFYAPALKKAIEKAFLGDISEDPLAISIELSDGREFSVNAKIGLVRNRDGEVSRAVIVLNVIQ